MPDYEITITSHSTKNGTYSVDATVSRNIVTADVLDYDGYRGNYALIWKKITITHTQRQLTSASGEIEANEYDNQAYGDLDWLIPYTVDSNFTSNATRTVEFYLTYSINGTKFDKLLCTCTMGSTYSKHGDEGVSSQVFSGERVWGCSIQVNADFITYQFKKEVPVDGLNRNWGGQYDGNYTFESWMIDRDEVSLWKLKSHVVGLINVNDGLDSEVGYLKEEEYDVGENQLNSSEIYSIGVVNT